jgi:dTDP-4-dehydrorhamnose 3,5-epimerase
MARATPTEIPDVVVVEPAVHGDDRGFLLETYAEPAWKEFGIEGPFVQENHSRSTRKGTLRGLHCPTEPGQAKLVRCLRGAIIDVAVDLRRDSPTYGQWVGEVLDDETHHQLWVPVGFAHGFQVLSEVADVAYKLTSLYDPETESGIAWDDPEVGVEWPIDDPILSERDTSAPRLNEIAAKLPF